MRPRFTLVYFTLLYFTLLRSRYFTGLAGAAAPLYQIQISVAAALGSVVFAALATCPYEVLRIRAVRRDPCRDSQFTYDLGELDL